MHIYHFENKTIDLDEISSPQKNKQLKCQKKCCNTHESKEWHTNRKHHILINNEWFYISLFQIKIYFDLHLKTGNKGWARGGCLPFFWQCTFSWMVEMPKFDTMNWFMYWRLQLLVQLPLSPFPFENDATCLKNSFKKNKSTAFYSWQKKNAYIRRNFGMYSKVNIWYVSAQQSHGYLQSTFNQN